MGCKNVGDKATIAGIGITQVDRDPKAGPLTHP